MDESPLAGADGTEPAAVTGFSSGLAGRSRAVPRVGTQLESQSRQNSQSLLGGRIPAWLPPFTVYLLLAIGMWWHVWTGGHPGSTMTVALGDPPSFVWFLEWPAYAISHGHSLFLATSDHVPAGLNLLDNTSVLALGVVLAPVTWLFGPIATLNVALTAAPALSAISAYGCLRRGLGVWRPAAFVAGLLFGFSPFVQRNETYGHLQVTFLALVPLIFLCVYELTVTQRGRWWRWGLLLGVLVTIQFFIGTEILTMVALTASGSALLALAGGALTDRRILAQKLPFAARGLGLACGMAGILLAYPIWFATAGPDHVTGSDWIHATALHVQDILLPIPQSHGHNYLPFAGYLGPPGLTAGYLGLIAVAVVMVAAVLVRRPLPKLCLAIMVMAAWASVGHHHLGWVVPSIWDLAKHVPVLDQATPQNFIAMAIWAIVVSAALLLDWVWQNRSGAPFLLASARIARPVLVGGIALVISAGLVLPWLLAWPMPFTAESVATQAPLSRLLASLPANSVVLFYPFPSSARDAALVWQAKADMRFKVAGGRGIAAGPGGAADHGLDPSTPEGMLAALSTSYQPVRRWVSGLPPMPTPQVISTLRQTLRHWQVAEVVMAGRGRDPAYARQWLTKILGAPPHLLDGHWVWTGVQQLIS